MFSTGDIVKVNDNGWHHGKIGKIVAIDGMRNQYMVLFESGKNVNFNNSFWFNEDELSLEKKRTWTDDNESEGYYYKAPSENKCSHELKLYIGLTEQFNYCVNCGKSEEELNEKRESEL